MLFLFGGRVPQMRKRLNGWHNHKARNQNDKGGAIDGKIGKWDKFRVAGEFALEGKGVTAGDTTVIKLEDPIITEVLLTLELKDTASGQTVATAHVDKEAGTITLTYTSFVDTFKCKWKLFSSYAAADSAKQSVASGDVPVNVNATWKTKFREKAHDGWKAAHENEPRPRCAY